MAGKVEAQKQLADLTDFQISADGCSGPVEEFDTTANPYERPRIGELTSRDGKRL